MSFGGKKQLQSGNRWGVRRLQTAPMGLPARAGTKDYPAPAGERFFFAPFDVKRGENHQRASALWTPGAFIRGDKPPDMSVPSKGGTTAICCSIPASPLRRRGLLSVRCTVVCRSVATKCSGWTKGGRQRFSLFMLSFGHIESGPRKYEVFFLWEAGPVSFWGLPKRNGTGKNRAPRRSRIFPRPSEGNTPSLHLRKAKKRKASSTLSSSQFVTDQPTLAGASSSGVTTTWMSAPTPRSFSTMPS